jgi:hypothetical protein
VSCIFPLCARPAGINNSVALKYRPGIALRRERPRRKPEESEVRAPSLYYIPISINITCRTST